MGHNGHIGNQLKWVLFLGTMQSPLYFLISNFRGPVPVPVHDFTTLEEIKKSFDLCEEYFKPPFGLYSEKR